MRALRLWLCVAVGSLLVLSLGAARVAASGDENAAAAAAAAAAAGTARGAELDSVTELMGHASGVFGKTRKWGLPKQWFKLMSHMTNLLPQEHGLPHQMTPELFRWFARVYSWTTVDGERPPTNPEPEYYQSPVPSCHFYVDHQYKLIYVRTTKTGGTTLSQTLGFKENPMVCKWAPHWCLQKCKDRQLCMEYIKTPEELPRLWRQYLVFTFVRNPYSRAVSSYKHINKYAVNRNCQTPFSNFAAMPSSYGARCLDTRGCCRQRFGWVLEHLEPQSTCFFTASDQTAVDFIGRVEHIDEDFQELVAMINARRNASIAPLEVAQLPHLMVSEENTTDSKAAEAAHRRAYGAMYLNGSAVEDVARYYARDFELLKYPRSEEEAAEMERDRQARLAGARAASGGGAPGGGSKKQDGERAEERREQDSSGGGGGTQEPLDGPLR